MIVAGGSIAGAVVAIVTAWNTLAVPFLNSELSPVVGAKSYIDDRAADQKAQQAIVDTLKQTNDTLSRTNQNVEALSKWQARRDCEDYNRRVRIYTDALKKNPRDAFAIELRNQALSGVQTIPGCMLEQQ